MKKSVALQYRQGMDAPRIIAKGTGAAALQINQIAQEAGVQVFEVPDLVDGLIKEPLEGYVPPGFYEIIAEILSLVYQVEKNRQGEDERSSG